MQTHKVMKYFGGTWKQVGVVEIDAQGRSNLVLSEPATGRLLLHPITQVRAVAAPHQYNEPGMEFDDDIPFAPVGLQYPALLNCS